MTKIALSRIILMASASIKWWVSGVSGQCRLTRSAVRSSSSSPTYRTVLFASYNNHPIDGVVEKLQNLEYKGQKIPFPIIRLGSNAMVKEAITTMRALWARCQQMQVFEETLDRNKKERTVRARELAKLLKRYEDILELQERKETLERLLEARGQMDFQVELLGQLDAVKKQLAKSGTITTEDALAQRVDQRVGVDESAAAGVD